MEEAGVGRGRRAGMGGEEALLNLTRSTRRRRRRRGGSGRRWREEGEEGVERGDGRGGVSQGGPDCGRRAGIWNDVVWLRDFEVWK